MTLRTYLNNIIAMFQLFISAGLAVRCILVIQKCREEGCSWKQTMSQIWKFIIIGAITMTITPLVAAIERYFW